MDAIQFNFQTKRLQLVHKEIPSTVEDNKVLIQVYYAGVCGTDIHILDGEFPCKEDGPITLGHEFSGVVVKIGKCIKHIQVGDRVVADPNKGCNVCMKCHQGFPNYCSSGGLDTTTGIYVDGGWQHYVSVFAEQVYKLPDGLSLEKASLTEPMSCISHAWDRISPLPIGSRILILGSGIIGNLFTALLHSQGHRTVTISEPSEFRRKLTTNLETNYEIIIPDVLKQRQKDPNYLFDLIIDACGRSQAVEDAIASLDFGGRLLIFGVSNPKATIGLSPYIIFKKELTILGTLINPFSFPKALSLLQSMSDRYIEFSRLGVEVFQLQDYQKAIKSLREGKIAKATFKLHH